MIAYDDMGGAFAARLWWMCRWIGIAQAGLLDGGVSKWIADGYALSTAVPPSIHTALRAAADPRMLVSAQELLPRLGQPDWALIDARAAERFSGETEPIDPVAGHIPSARNHFHKENLNADLTFKSRDVLREKFDALRGTAPVENVIHQCGSGVTACVNLFAMELAGLADSKLYAGSWSEWIADPSRPIA